MRDNIAKATMKLFAKYKNPYNDVIKRAAFDVAISNSMMDPLEVTNKNNKELIKAEYASKEEGYQSVILADGGVSVLLRVSKGASRFDSKLLPASVIRLGWLNKDGKPLTMVEIGELIAACTKTNAPSFTITSTVADNE